MKTVSKHFLMTNGMTTADVLHLMMNLILCLKNGTPNLMKNGMTNLRMSVIPYLRMSATMKMILNFHATAHTNQTERLPMQGIQALQQDF